MLELPVTQLDKIIDAIQQETSRRFKGEGLCTLNIVRFLGTPLQQQRIRELYDRLSTAQDPFIAVLARWNNSNTPDQAMLESSYQVE